MVWARAEEQLRGSAGGDDEELSAFVPTAPRRPPPGEETVRKCRQEELLEMTPWSSFEYEAELGYERV